MVLLYVATFVVGFAAIALWVILNPGKEEKLKGEDNVVEDDDIPLNEEPWIPTMEVKDWTEAASFESCPWNFGHCESVEDVLNCIWKTPVPKDLHVGFDAMQKSVKSVSIAYVKLGTLKEIHYCILYTLRSGAELFGGAPSEQTVGLELDPGEETAGLRRRRGAEASANSWRIVNDENPLPCIAAFFRIHDGFGTLMSRKHLPLLLESPGDTIHGSCFYVYPKRGLQPMGQRPTLLRMARVDKTCCVAVDRRKANLTQPQQLTRCRMDHHEHLDSLRRSTGMLNVAAAFGGGLLIRQTLEEIKLPKFKRASEEGVTFRLSVRVVAAAVPALGKPGWMSSQRPRLEVSVGDTHKETELGDYEEGNSRGSCDGASKDCPWRFGDTLTFKLNLQDVLGPGLKLKLRAVSDITKVDEAMRKLFVFPLWAAILWLAAQIAVRLVEPSPQTTRRELPRGLSLSASPAGFTSPWRSPEFERDARQLSVEVGLYDDEDDTNDTNDSNWTDSFLHAANEEVRDCEGLHFFEDLLADDSDDNTTTTTTFTVTSSTGTRTSSTATTSTKTTSTATTTSKTVTTSTETTSTRTTSTATTTSKTVTTSTKTTSTATTSTATTTSKTITTSTATTSTATTITVTGTTTTPTTTTLTTTTLSTTTLTTTTQTSTRTTATQSTTSTTTVWGDIIIALDFTVDDDRRGALLDFAADVVHNVTGNVGDLSVAFGLILFAADEYEVTLEPGTPPEDFLFYLHSAGMSTFVDRQRPPDTASVLDVCAAELNKRIADVSIVVVLTNSVSDSPVQTQLAASRLKFEGIGEVVVIAVGMDPPDERTSIRQNELEQMATSPSFEYDAYYDQVDGGRRLRSLLAPVPLSQLAEKLVPQVAGVILQITTTAVAPEETSRGVGAGIILLAVLGGICCFSAVAAVSFLVCKRMKEGEEEQKKMSDVVPAPSDAGPAERPPIEPQPRPNLRPEEPDDDMQQQIKAAMGAQDLRRLRKLLSEILLKGYPPPKYTALVLKALEWVEAHKPEAESALKKAMNRKISGEVQECVMDARFCGVDYELLNQAANIQLQLAPGGVSAGTLRSDTHGSVAPCTSRWEEPYRRSVARPPSTAKIRK
eukprot:s1815_g7.t1